MVGVTSGGLVPVLTGTVRGADLGIASKGVKVDSLASSSCERASSTVSTLSSIFSLTMSMPSISSSIASSSICSRMISFSASRV